MAPKAKEVSGFILRKPDPETWRLFKERAEREGHPLHWVLRRLIERYVERGLD